MIKINRYFTKKDRDSIYKDLSKKKQDKEPLFDNLVKQKSNHRFHGEFYASDKIKRKLQSFFNDKCAFCESYSKSDEDEDRKLKTIWQVEHYRPKGRVTEDKEHGGYYWLAYECTNLLTACYRCNALNKGNHFPIKGETDRSTADSFIVNTQINFDKCNIFEIEEQAILLNPVIDNPNDFLFFCKDGSIKSKEENERGEKTITILGLNKADLVKERKTIIDSIREEIQNDAYRLFYDSKKKKDFNVDETNFKIIIKHYLYKKILMEVNNPLTPYIGFRLAIFKNFEEFVLKNEDKITDKEFVLPYRSELIKAYHSIIKKIV